jgi:hypothetical protein
MNRRNFLSFLAAIPCLGFLRPTPYQRFTLSQNPPPTGTPTTNIWWHVGTWGGDQYGIAGPGQAVMWIGDGKWVSLHPGAQWIASEREGFVVDGLKIAESPYA